MLQQQFNLPSQEAINAQIATVLQLIQELKDSIEAIEKQRFYYRNKDLKKEFGLSDNTIIKYRDENIIPYTYLGEIYFYPVDGIDEILEKNSNYDLVKT
jgi:hypothetical protein